MLPHLNVNLLPFSVYFLLVTTRCSMHVTFYMHGDILEFQCTLGNSTCALFIKPFYSDEHVNKTFCTSMMSYIPSSFRTHGPCSYDLIGESFFITSPLSNVVLIFDLIKPHGRDGKTCRQSKIFNHGYHKYHDDPLLSIEDFILTAVSQQTKKLSSTLFHIHLFVLCFGVCVCEMNARLHKVV